MEEFLRIIISNLVNDQESIEINTIDNGKSVTFEVKVAQEDMGKIIGKQGRIAQSIRNVMKAVTNKEHMPDNHRAYGEWNQERILEWSKTIGPNTYKVILGIFNNARVEQQVYNQCITILKLKDKYSSQILEHASGIIIEKNITPIHKNFKSIIENIQELKGKENETNN